MKRSLLILILLLILISSLSYCQQVRFASWYLLEGIKDYEQGLYIKAIIDLKSAVHLNSNLVLAYKYLGLSYSKMYLWEQAAREYNKILLYDSIDPDRYSILKSIYEWERKKEYLTAKARYSYYALKYQQEVWREPYNLLNYLALAEIYECEGEYEKAQGFYGFLETENPGKTVFSVYLAESIALSGKDDDSELIYNKILKEEPLNLNAILGLNYVLKKKYEKTLEDRPNDTDAAFGLARALKSLKRYENAIEVYTSALNKDYLNADARIEMAECYESIGRYEEAINQYKMLNRLDPKDIKHLFMLARMYEKVGSNKDAKETYKKILVVDTENQEARMKLEQFRVKYRFDLNALNNEDVGRGGTKDSNYYGAGIKFFAPFDISNRAIYGYSNSSFKAGILSKIDVFSYVIGGEKDLPLNYKVYAEYLHTIYSTNRVSGNFDMGIIRGFLDGGYFAISLSRKDILDNQNTVNNELVVDTLNIKTFNPIFDKVGIGVDGRYMNYIDNNSGLDMKISGQYSILTYPRDLNLVFDLRYYNTAVALGKDYWTPKDYYETRIGTSWKYSFNENSFYLLSYMLGNDKNGIDSNDFSFEIDHDLDSWFSVKVKGDNYRSAAFESKLISCIVTLIL